MFQTVKVGPIQAKCYAKSVGVHAVYEVAKCYAKSVGVHAVYEVLGGKAAYGTIRTLVITKRSLSHSHELSPYKWYNSMNAVGDAV